MKDYKKLVSPFLFVAGCILTLPAVHAAKSAENKAEAQQMTEDMSPQGQYKIAKKEAAAAYQQALSDCKKMSKAERNSCVKEAKSNYQADLAQAKKALNSGR